MEAVQERPLLYQVQQAVQRLAQPAQAHEFLLSDGAALPLPILPPQSQDTHPPQVPYCTRARVLRVVDGRGDALSSPSRGARQARDPRISASPRRTRLEARSCKTIQRALSETLFPRWNKSRYDFTCRSFALINKSKRISSGAELIVFPHRWLACDNSMYI